MLELDYCIFLVGPVCTPSDISCLLNTRCKSFFLPFISWTSFQLFAFRSGYQQSKVRLSWKLRSSSLRHQNHINQIRENRGEHLGLPVKNYCLIWLIFNLRFSATRCKCQTVASWLTSFSRRSFKKFTSRTWSTLLYTCWRPTGGFLDSS